MINLLKFSNSITNKKGQAIVEAVLIVPVLLAMFFIMLQFSIFFDIKQKLIQSARYAGWDLVYYDVPKAPKPEKIDKGELKGYHGDEKKKKKRELKREAKKEAKEEYKQLIQPKKDALMAIITTILNHPDEDEAEIKFTRFKNSASDRLKDRTLKKELRKAKRFYKRMGFGKKKDFWKVEITDRFEIRHAGIVQAIFKASPRKRRGVRVKKRCVFKERYAILGYDPWKASDDDDVYDCVGKLWMFPLGNLFTAKKMDDIMRKVGRAADWGPLKSTFLKIDLDAIP